MGRAAVLLCALVALAGCGLPAGSQQSSPTLTPVPVPSDSPEPTPAQRLAPGLAPHGVVEPSRLAWAHASALRTGSFAVETTRVERGANGTVRERRHLEATVSADRTHYYVVRTQVEVRPDGRTVASRVETWANGTHVHVAEFQGDESSVRILRDGRGRPVPPAAVTIWRATGRERLLVLLGRLADETVGRANGTPTRYRVDATVPDPPTRRLSDGGELLPPADATFTARVRTDGLVTGYRYSLRGFTAVPGRQATPVTVEETGQFRDVDAAAVERPPWADRFAGVSD